MCPGGELFVGCGRGRAIAPQHRHTPWTRQREHCQAVRAQHIEEVQETIEPDRLLVFGVKQGRDPLCAFLSVPVPAGEPFPHVNDTAAFWAIYLG